LLHTSSWIFSRVTLEARSAAIGVGNDAHLCFLVLDDKI
jgi:hypothetical protein